jgi:hypothetical protein
MTTDTRHPTPEYVYHWHRQGRKGQRCAVLARARVMNSILVVFDDGYAMVTSRYAIRRLRDPSPDTGQTEATK